MSFDTFMTSYGFDFWIITAAVLSALSCSLLGNFLVLRRMSMMGDAISHAVLPGLAAAFLITGSRDSFTMFIGAAVVGILTAVLTEWIHSLGKVEQSASMGVVFTSLFALGLILIVQAADHVDLDAECVLYGAIELIPSFDPYEIPHAVMTLAMVCTLVLVFMIVFYKELKITAFDPKLATTLGINATVMHYLLMSLIAMTTVACFESVGSILVIAMLIVPAAAAFLLTQRLWLMIVISSIFAIVSAVGGHIAAITVPPMFSSFEDVSTSGAITTLAGVMFGIVLLIAPRQGIISKLVHRWRLSLRILCEDLLGLMYRLDETQVHTTHRMIQQIVTANSLLVELALWVLKRKADLVENKEGMHLTAKGKKRAGKLVRSHRLWESYLHKHMGLPVDHLHEQANRLEHITDEKMLAFLARSTDNPETDPQGRQIPS